MNEIKIELLNEYDKIKNKNINQANERKNIILNQNPVLKEIFEDINSIGFAHIKAMLEFPSMYEEAEKDLHIRLERLEKKKNEYIKNHNIDTSLFEPKFRCNLCKDTGYLDDDFCSCFNQNLAKKVFDMENTTLFTKTSLNDYTFDIFKTEEQKADMKLIHKKCIEYVNNFNKNTSRGFLFTGNSGLGKTHLLTAIANDLIEKGVIVIYITSNKLVDSLKQAQFGSNTSYKELLEKADLLIIDDLAKEITSPYNLSLIFDLFNSRYISNAPILISTNISMGEIRSIYGEEIVSRLSQTLEIIGFKGKNIRV